MMLIVMVLPLFVACGSDSDDNDNGGSNGGAAKNKRVAKIVTEDGGNIYDDTYFYDEQNRVVKVVTKEYSDSPSETVRTYQYGETVIVVNQKVEGIRNGGESYSRSWTRTYTLDNGLIIKDKDTQGGSETYTYDSNGYMKTKGSSQLVWNNGNLMKVSNTTYDYSNTPWVNIGLKLISGTDGNLGIPGYYGKMPKMMPSKIGDKTYQYTVEGGLLTKVMIYYTEKGYDQISINNITWE